MEPRSIRTTRPRREPGHRSAALPRPRGNPPLARLLATVLLLGLWVLAAAPAGAAQEEAPAWAEAWRLPVDETTWHEPATAPGRVYP